MKSRQVSKNKEEEQNKRFEEIEEKLEEGLKKKKSEYTLIYKLKSKRNLEEVANLIKNMVNVIHKELHKYLEIEYIEGGSALKYLFEIGIITKYKFLEKIIRTKVTHYIKLHKDNKNIIVGFYLKKDKKKENVEKIFNRIKDNLIKHGFKEVHKKTN